MPRGECQLPSQALPSCALSGQVLSCLGDLSVSFPPLECSSCKTQRASAPPSQLSCRFLWKILHPESPVMDVQVPSHGNCKD